MKYLKEFFQKSDTELVESFNFKDIYEAVEFMKKACDVFNELDHHPNYFCLEGKTIKIKLTTHSEGGVTDKDFEVVDSLKGLVKDCCKPLNPHLY
jgi:4a-hydroxytetrahydrobiopterin dehydratase